MYTHRHQDNAQSFPDKRRWRRSLPDPISRRRDSASSPVKSRFAAIARATWESGLVLVAVLIYFLVRGLISSSNDRAIDHAYALLDLERALNIAWETGWQAWAQGIPGLMGIMNSIYIYGHWPVIALTLAWLLWRHGDTFRLMRNAMVISGLIGFAFFALYPMAPPRFLDDLGLIDTIMRDTSSYRVLQPPSVTNQYAAMPSLHVGWNLLMGIAIFQTTRRWSWRAFAILMHVAMWVATIMTANHFVLDGVVGSIVALIGLAIAMLLRAKRHDPPIRAPAGKEGIEPGPARSSTPLPQPSSPRP